MPKVSVIIPAHNSSKTIEQVLNSVLAQTYPAHEIIVVDDGSTDDTREIISKYAIRTTHDIKYIYQSNKGPAAARNAGLRMAQGEYISFLDSDDIIMPGKLSIQVRYLDSHPEVDLVYSWWNYIDEEGRELPEVPRPKQSREALRALLFDCFFPIHSVLVRRKCFKEAGLFDEAITFGEDWDMWLRVALGNSRISYIPRALVSYRVRTGGSMRDNVGHMLKDRLMVIDKVYARSSLPKEIMDMREMVYANIYFQSAIEHYGQAQRERAIECFKTAYELHPQLFRDPETFNKIAYSIDSLFGYRTRQAIYDNAEKIEKIILDILDAMSKASLGFDKREIYAVAYIQLATLNYYGRNLKNARSLFLKSFTTQPSLVLRDKNLFTFLKALLPKSFFKKAKCHKILYVLDIFPAVSETFILNEILELEKHGADVAIFARRNESTLRHGILNGLKAQITYLPNAHELQNRGLLLLHMKIFFIHPFNYLKTFLFALKRRNSGTFWFFKVACLYAAMARRYDPSRIHAHFASTAGEYGMLISMILGVPYTFTAHGWHDIFEYPPADFKDRIDHAEKVITISEYNKNYLRNKYLIPQGKMEVIHCGIDVNSFNGHQKELTKTPVILSVGRLHPIKGAEYLIKACKLLKEHNLRFKCILIGDGEERRKIENLIDSLGISNVVRLEGSRPIEDVRKQYLSVDIYVQPSLCEGIPISVMEAMASKLPVVATNVTGLPELVEDGVTGYLVAPKDEKAIAAAIVRLINNHDNSKLMGELGRKKVERDFNLKTEVDKLAKVLLNGKN